MSTKILKLEHLRQKALHAFFSLRRHTDFNKLKPSIACKIFDSKILPILTYNSEVWGAFVKSDFKSWDLSPIEKTHLQFCKRYLEVHNKASNIACRAELGKFPLIIDINKKILSYLNYLHQKDENSIVRQALKISIDLYDNGKNSFYSSVMKINEYYNFNHFNYSSLNDCSTYLDLTRKDPLRKTLVKLRISCHKLRIETGRYDNIPRNERICNFCNCNKIEDETHFLLDCPAYSQVRGIFFSKIESKLPLLRLLPRETLLSHLMNSTDYFVNIKLISFISACFELRDNLVTMITTSNS